jgi:hypothetical protein
VIKKVIRTFLFSYLALYSAQYVIGTIVYDDSDTVLYFVIGLSILYIFLKPLISIVSMPTKGSVFFLVSFISTGLVFFALSNVLPDVSFQPVTLRSLNILGYVLPSKDLSSLWAMVFSALTTNAIYLFLEGLCRR